MWVSFTDLLPLDLLSRVLPVSGRAQDGIRMVQSRGARGFQFSGSPQLFSFPASQLFINCNFFPAEFSIVVTLKIPQMAPEVRTKKDKDIVEFKFENIKEPSEAFSSEYALDFWIAIVISLHSLMCRRVNTSSHCWREIQMSRSSACVCPKTSSTFYRRVTVAGNTSLLRQ